MIKLNPSPHTLIPLASIQIEFPIKCSAGFSHMPEPHQSATSPRSHLINSVASDAQHTIESNLMFYVTYTLLDRPTDTQHPAPYSKACACYVHSPRVVHSTLTSTRQQHQRNCHGPYQYSMCLRISPFLCDVHKQPTNKTKNRSSVRIPSKWYLCTPQSLI